MWFILTGNLNSHRYQSQGDVEQLWAWLPGSWLPLPDMGCTAAGGPRGPAACGGWRDRVQGSSLPPGSSQRHFPLLCSERQKQAAESRGILHQRPSRATAELPTHARVQGDRVGAISPIDKGAQSQHTPPSESLRTHFPSLLSPYPRARGARSPHKGCSSRAGDFPSSWSHSCGPGELCILALSAEQGSAMRLKQMFCGLCSMLPQPAAASSSQAPVRPDPGHKL